LWVFYFHFFSEFHMPSIHWLIFRFLHKVIQFITIVYHFEELPKCSAQKRLNYGIAQNDSKYLLTTEYLCFKFQPKPAKQF
jgi:hypothetical protein